MSFLEASETMSTIGLPVAEATAAICDAVRAKEAIKGLVPLNAVNLPFTMNSGEKSVLTHSTICI